MEPSEAPRGIDPAPVTAWLVQHVGLVAPIRYSVISGGHSNITYFATDAAGTTIVLRRPPIAAKNPKAHDMAREHRVISALAGSAVPVPAALGLCEDASINDAPFYVMSKCDGNVIDNPPAADAHLCAPGARQRASEQIVDVMADMHRVDIDAVGLGEAARRDAFLERQVTRYRSLWTETKTRELPLIESVGNRLAEMRPPQRYTGIVHSDYRFGNVMLGEDGTLTGVLDWELWTLGDVLSDVGFLLNNWYEPDDTIPLIWMEVPPTMAGGFASRTEVLERYAARTGFDLSDVPYYRAFQYWKVAILAEGVKRRYETAQMVSETVDFAHMNKRVIDLVDLADLSLRELR